jgi:hypothetical protein
VVVRKVVVRNDASVHKKSGCQKFGLRIMIVRKMVANKVAVSKMFNKSGRKKCVKEM